MDSDSGHVSTRALSSDSESRERKTIRQAEAAHLLGVSPETLKQWRKKRCGPEWYAASRSSGHGQPMYFLDSVEKLRAVYLVLEEMGLRHANCAALPPDDREAVV